jgi:cold shock CspA family protein
MPLPSRRLVFFFLNEGDKVSFVLEDDRKGRGKQAGQVQKA